MEVYTPAIQADSTQDPEDAGYSSSFSFVTLKRDNEVLENAIMLFKKPNKSISKQNNSQSFHFSISYMQHALKKTQLNGLSVNNFKSCSV